MKQINPELWKRFDKFFAEISKKDSVAIYHDSDPDGTCSAVLLATAIQRLRGKPVETHLSPTGGERFLPDETISFLRSKGTNILFTTDIALDEHPEQVAKAAEFAKVVIIDHHKIYSDFNNENILLLKPQFLVEGIEPAPYCSSKLVYDLCSRHVDLSDKDWIAAVGIISDMAAAAWKEFLHAAFKKQKYSTRESKESSEWFNTKLGRISEIISSAEVYDPKNADKCFEVLFSAKRPQDVLASELVQFEKEISEEIKKYMRNMKKDAEFFKEAELVYYQIQPKHNIKSPLCTIASLKYPKRTVILASIIDGRAYVSARRRDKKIAMNNLLENACKNFLNANAGGHIPAAGASFPAHYLPEFKKSVVNVLKKEKFK